MCITAGATSCKPQGLNLFKGWLSLGLRITGVGGSCSDSCRPQKLEEGDGNLAFWTFGSACSSSDSCMIKQIQNNGADFAWVSRYLVEPYNSCLKRGIVYAY